MCVFEASGRIPGFYWWCIIDSLLSIIHSLLSLQAELRLNIFYIFKFPATVSRHLFIHEATTCYKCGDGPFSLDEQKPVDKKRYVLHSVRTDTVHVCIHGLLIQGIFHPVFMCFCFRLVGTTFFEIGPALTDICNLRTITNRKCPIKVFACVPDRFGLLL